MNINYRPEIDGLRAIAVISVVLYHAEFLFNGHVLLSGGFLGVDVFFVISGFLITSIIYKESESGCFSMLNFYERRVRRILPALFTIMIVVIPFAYITLMSDAFKSFSGSVMCTLLFCSNIWFWIQDSYTAPASQLMPLLHTWSLSIEEQFYVVFPLLFLYLKKVARYYLLEALVFLAMVSLLYAQLIVDDHPDTAFYLISARAWELLAGSIIAVLIQQKPNVRSIQLPAVIAYAGLFLIFLPMVIMDDAMPHPSLLTLFPVLGTALLLTFSHREQGVGRLLAHPILVGIGLISYSLYLWHFPIFAIMRGAYFEFGTVAKMVGILMALILSFISYRLIEKPSRDCRRLKFSVLAGILLTVFISLFFASYGIFKNHGMQERFSSHGGVMDGSSFQMLYMNSRKCHNRKFHNSCESTVKTATENIFLIGDSHAQVYARGLHTFSIEHEFNYIQYTRAGCLQVPGMLRVKENGEEVRGCNQRNYKIMDRLRKETPSIIIYNSRYSIYFENKRFDNGEGGVEEKIKQQPTLPITTVEDEFVEKNISLGELFQQTISEWLALGHKVILIYPVPEVGWNVPSLVSAKLSKKLREESFLYAFPYFNNKGLSGVRADKQPLSAIQVDTSLAVYRKRNSTAFSILDGIGLHENIFRIYPHQYLCSAINGRCKTHDDQGFYYVDDDHLNDRGAALIKENLEKLILVNSHRLDKAR